MFKYCSVEELKGKVLTKIDVTDDRIDFFTQDNLHYIMHHIQDCCENVYIEDIDGDIQGMVGEQIVLAETVDNIDREPVNDYPESYTWTYYKFATRNGYVTIRWYGESNGYYSEYVDFSLVDDCSQDN